MRRRYDQQGDRVRDRRKELRLTGQAVADLVGVSQAAYSAWENGNRDIPARRREALGAALQTTWLDLARPQYEVNSIEPDEPAELTTPTAPTEAEFVFKCGQLIAHVDTMAHRWRANPHLLAGLSLTYREKLEAIFEAGLM